MLLLQCQLLLHDAATEAVAAPPLPPPFPTTGAGEQLPGPVDPTNISDVAQWRAALVVWKAAIKKAVNYSDSLAERYYGSPSLAWTQTSFIQPQMHPCRQPAAPAGSQSAACSS